MGLESADDAWRMTTDPKERLVNPHRRLELQRRRVWTGGRGTGSHARAVLKAGIRSPPTAKLPQVPGPTRHTPRECVRVRVHDAQGRRDYCRPGRVHPLSAALSGPSLRSGVRSTLRQLCGAGFYVVHR
jgi:hypothetical protein